MSESPFKGAPSFLKRVAGFAAALAVGVPAAQEAGKAYERHQVAAEQESIEKEAGQIHADIQHGLQAQTTYATALTEYNKLIDVGRQLDEDSEAYKNLKEERQHFGKKIIQYEVERGAETLGLLEHANPYAQSLENDPVAIHNLAIARTLFAEGTKHTGDEDLTLGYWHNCAAAYKELGKKSEAQIREKFRSLFDHVKTHKELDLAYVQHEQILFFLLEDSFDLSLTPEKLRAELEKRDPTWAQEKATHVNKETYRSFNDVSTLNIFELNRLHAVVTQMNNPEFQASLFETRDNDLDKSDTEVGGLIPRPEQDHKLHSIDAKETGNNQVYMKPLEGAVLQFSTLSEFHFHATHMKEEETLQGPSGADFSFFTPGVVFSSIDDHTIRAHFYVSRDMPRRQGPLNDVISLGTVTK